jgi:8-oxo-dGTP diphosphatase
MSASSAKYPIRWAFSAGGIVYRLQGSALQVALIRVREVWTLPKGAIERGEKSESAALREVQEETGLAVEPQEKLGEIAYWFVNRQERVRTYKNVTFFLFEALSDDTSGHDREVDEVRFWPAAETLYAVSYPKDREILKKALQVLAEKKPI